MARTPNYNFERQERDRAKAARKMEKLAAKAAAREQAKAGDAGDEEAGDRPSED